MKLNSILRTVFPLATPMYVVDEDESVGGPSENGGDTIGSGNDERLALLDRINDRNDAERADELQFVNDDGTTEPFTVEGDPNADDVVVNEVKPDEEVAPIKEEAVKAPRIKVNGEDVELTPELIAKAQKIASGDKYLEEAAIARKAVTIPEKEEVQLPSKEDIEQRSDEEELALVRAIQMGTEEEAVAALRKIRNRSPGVTAEDIGRIADERLNFKTALAWFESEYKDLVDDPQLHGIVWQRDKDLVTDGDKRPYEERFKQVGDEVREWRDAMVKKYTTKPVENSLESKEARKSAAPKAIVAANAKAKPKVDEDESDESPSAVISNMAKARGGPQWARN